MAVLAMTCMPDRSRRPIGHARCGFLGNSHFSRCFRNQYGKTASRVREAASGESAAAVQVSW
jgi:transcriptional regulator GlxA family with amidase domain